MTKSNCTLNENNFDINIPTLSFTIACGPSFMFIEFDEANFNETLDKTLNINYSCMNNLTFNKQK